MTNEVDRSIDPKFTHMLSHSGFLGNAPHFLKSEKEISFTGGLTKEAAFPMFDTSLSRPTKVKCGSGQQGKSKQWRDLTLIDWLES